MRFRDSLLRQAEACAALGSPFMERLMRLLHARLSPGTPLTDRLLNWPGDTTGTGDAVALRLAGALHRLVLRNADPALVAAYPPNTVSDDALWAAVDGAMTTHAAKIDAWLASPPQTNEIRRSVMLIAAAHWLAGRYDHPMRISELGASAGLNLNWDQYALRAGTHSFGPTDAPVKLTPKWQGSPPPAKPIKIAERRGVDLAPPDTSDPNETQRLLSYLWPDQPERLERTRAALRLPAQPVDRGDAVAWLADRLHKPRRGQTHLIYHTIAWQYFPNERQAIGTHLIETAGRAATEDAPLAWLRFEADGQSPGAALTLRLWPGDHIFDLARAGYHGEWIDWRMPRLA